MEGVGDLEGVGLCQPEIGLLMAGHWDSGHSNWIYCPTNAERSHPIVMTNTKTKTKTNTTRVQVIIYMIFWPL